MVKEAHATLDVGTLFATPSSITRSGAEIICRRFGLDMVRFANSGTEATMYALRTARAATGKLGVIKIEGGYHGSYDPLMVSAKPEIDRAGDANSPNAVPLGATVPGDVWVVPYNDAEAIERVLKKDADQITTAIRAHKGLIVRKVSDRTFLLHLGGKLEVQSKVPLKTRDDLSRAYTPGVARICQAIADGDSLVTENVFESRFMFVNELSRLGAQVHVDGHHASIHGITELSGAPVEATDIRAGAGLVLAALVADGVTTVDGAFHVDRGYPEFAEQLRALGADVTRE